MTSAMSKPKSKLPLAGWTGPGLARRQCSEWLPRRNSGEYAPLPKLSPTSDNLPDVKTKVKVLYDDTNDSGSDVGKVKGMFGGSLYDASGEELSSESEDEAVSKIGSAKTAMGFPQKSPVSTNGTATTATLESQRAAQRLAKISSSEGPSEAALWRVVPSSSGSANGRSSSSTSGNLISFKEEAGSEELLFGTTSQEPDKVTSATSKLINTASSPLSPATSPTALPTLGFPGNLAVTKSRPASHQGFLLDDWQKSVKPRTSLEAIRQQIRQIECEIVCSQAEQDFYSGHNNHDYPSSRPIQASYSSQSIPATFDSNRASSRVSYPYGMQRAYSVDVAVQSAISDIQSAVRHNSQIKLKGSSNSNLSEQPRAQARMASPHALWSARAAIQASIHEENDSVWVKRDVKMPEVPTAEDGDDSSCSTALIMTNGTNGCHGEDEAAINESMQLLSTETGHVFHNNHPRIGQLNPRPLVSRKVSTCQEAAHELIEGLLFRCCYLGSTHLFSDSRPTKASRLTQAQEAVTRIKAPDGESQPMSDVDLFISIDKIMVLNADIQDVLMDHPLRTISYIADIGDLVVLMVKRGLEDLNCDAVLRFSQPRMLCHVFQSDEASAIAQTIGNAFQVAYMEYLKANGVQDDRYLRHLDYLEVLNSQEMSTNELDLFASKEKQINVVIPKTKGEILGVVIVESGWGSMLPTVIIANLCPTGPAARCGKLSIGDQLISIDGISLVGLPLAHCQTIIKNVRNHTVVKLTVVSCPPVVEVRIKRPDTRYQLGFSVQNGIICSLLRGGIAERGGIRVGHRIIEINGQSVVATNHDSIVNMLAHSAGEIELKTMPSSIFRLLTGQDIPVYI